MVVGDFSHEKEVIIVGGGPGGYHAAIRAAQLGKEVAIIEKNAIGGICLNNGCISSKLFAEAAKRMRDAADLSSFGVTASSLSFDMSALQERKETIITNLTKGVKALLNKYHVEMIKGEATFLADNQIGVERGESFEKYQFEQAVIATGATYTRPDSVSMEHKRILDPSTLYKLKELPEHLIVYGSDYQAVEAASTFSALGSQVTFAYKDELPYDPAVTKELLRLMKKHKIKVIKETSLEECSPGDNDITVSFLSDSKEKTVTASHLYISCTQKPNTPSLRLDACGVNTDEYGFIPITPTTETNQPHIFAVGDVTPNSELAVESIKQGKVAGERMAGEKSEWDPYAIPQVTHAIRPIASVGLTAESARKEGFDVAVGNFSLSANGYAALTNKKEGVIKIISEKKTDVILGFQAIGEGSVEMISQAVQSLEMGARDEDITYPFYPHPSFNEAWLEAAESLKNKAVHRV
ncbi:dihydrolipoyl dehydrogenase family protein [Alteribacillus iranensis]|uniref:Dihydrolipoamide dehydrogenase n=1 Tax=Alteribacillus iranensis TaxID=930128 RepID=A0A1I2DPH8_9BACI|nr:NAD(P)/FAD-dependent oxidoreductase [Alteribacillus iranensis]SFE82426.1 dihydrolipoamide dehydrogenase [Alteribacillus iranensis]